MALSLTEVGHTCQDQVWCQCTENYDYAEWILYWKEIETINFLFTENKKHFNKKGKTKGGHLRSSFEKELTSTSKRSVKQFRNK